MKVDRFTLHSISIAFFLIFACADIGIAQKTDDVAMAQAFVQSNAAAIEELKPFEKFQLLRDLAPAAYKAGDYAKAEKFALALQDTATELVRESKAYTPSLEFATHISNTVLGLISFERGDLSKAGDHLIAAGTLKWGYPTLRSFGPNMLLAKKLVEKGEREAVLKYLEKCAGFWQMEDGRLAKWKKTIEDGGVPDFSRTLDNALSHWKH